MPDKPQLLTWSEEVVYGGPDGTSAVLCITETGEKAALLLPPDERVDLALMLSLPEQCPHV
ncbi:hypothetical protein DEJ49_33095 [Streptomyces venezuelae]|uniref:Uncharacterized protein n=1 Tax=Streptomyces venezuelae TaxID=54571 RepID=A0A5P2CSB8_STRVZ|nr:hypothetical protein [Streptomyces venezuelae]QES45180.1 hypothetical protein DEJ49_33095 [Streptomyces venezuelae]